MTEKEALKLAKKLEPKIKGHGVVGEYIDNGWNIYCKQVIKGDAKEDCWEASIFIDDLKGE
ncbi:hypothetical protein [Spiroplasma endosymbiont of Phycita roborella]|uniref:hypothetical protein n=1 Tax=Spiroplasma endosymbiont of Phycita roborella TaxID=3066311 RepID=UPI00313DF5C1